MEDELQGVNGVANKNFEKCIGAMEHIKRQQIVTTFLLVVIKSQHEVQC